MLDPVSGSEVPQESDGLTIDLGASITDIEVVDNDLTFESDFTVKSGHSLVLKNSGTTAKLNTGKNITVENGATLSIGSGCTLTNEGTIDNLGTLTNDGSVMNPGNIFSCGGTVNGSGSVSNTGNGKYLTNGNHEYENGKCKHCGAKEPEKPREHKKPSFSLKSGVSLDKFYDKTRNVYTGYKTVIDENGKEKQQGISLTTADLQPSGLASGDRLKYTSLSATFDNYNAGNRKVTITVKVTDRSSNTFDYSGTYTFTVSARIKPKPLNVTPRTGQSKIFGTKDPTYKASVSGLLSGDAITGKLGRNSGENVGAYKFNPGTLTTGIADTNGNFVKIDYVNYEIVVDQTPSFSITTKSIQASTPTPLTTDVKLANIAIQKYTGAKVEPALVLTYTNAQKISRTLVKNRDYTATFENNVQPGTAKVTITGIGNYSGTRTATFRIIKVASGGSYTSGGGSFSSGRSGSSFSDGEGDDFDDESEEDEDGEGDEDDDFDDDTDGDEGGSLIMGGEGYGTIVFNEEDEGRPFAQSEEDIDETQKRLIIKPYSMVDESTGEKLHLEEDESREKFEDLHLRVTPELAMDMIENGYSELSYVIENAALTLKLSELTEQLDLTPLLPANRKDGEANAPDDVSVATDDMYYGNEDEFVGSTDVYGDYAAAGEGDSVAEQGDLEINEPVVNVDVYDFCIRQIADDSITEREEKALELYETVVPTYRVEVEAESYDHFDLGDEEDDDIEIGDEDEDDWTDEPDEDTDIDDEFLISDEEDEGAGSEDDSEDETDEDDFDDEDEPYSYPVLSILETDVLKLMPLEKDEEVPENALLMFVSDDELLEDEEAVLIEPVAFETGTDTWPAVCAPEHSGLYTVVVEPEEEADESEDDEAEDDSAYVDPEPRYAYNRRTGDVRTYWLVNTEDRTVEYYSDGDGVYRIGDYTGSLMEGMTVTYRDDGEEVTLRLKFKESYKFCLMNDGGDDLLLEGADANDTDALLKGFR